MKYKRHKKRRKMLWEDCGGICQDCGIKTVLPEDFHRTLCNDNDIGNIMATVDHIIALADGGSKRGKWNQQILCYDCNVRKGSIKDNHLKTK